MAGRIKKRLARRFFIDILAEKGGFEPPLGYYPKHAFQACDLNHSSTSPKGAQDKPECFTLQDNPPISYLVSPFAHRRKSCKFVICGEFDAVMLLNLTDDFSFRAA